MDAASYNEASLAVITPKALRRGETIGVVAPAGPVDRARIERALERLHRRGFRTKTYGDVYRSQDYLAGDDATRARELMTAFEDAETTAVWCARGGYGVTRILDRLDFDVIRRHPKIFVGFSDITGLHLAIQRRVGLITFHGPNLQDGFGLEEDMTPITEAALWQATLADDSLPPALEYALPPGAEDGGLLRTLAPGVATGRLTGGNLSVLCGLSGTPFEVETAGRILLLEDVDEPPYRVDRYLSQLRLGGKLQAAAGIVLGGFDDDRQPSAEQVREAIAGLMREYCGRLGVPVLAGFPSGHQTNNFALPINALVELDADRGSLKVLEHPVLQVDDDALRR